MYGFRFAQHPDGRWSYVRQRNGVDLPASWQARNIYSTFADHDGARRAGLEWSRLANARAAEHRAAARLVLAAEVQITPPTFTPCPRRYWHHVGSTCPTCGLVDRPMDDFTRDLIAYLTERGYRVTRTRATTRTGQLSGKRLLTEHAAHRTGSPDLDRCRLCRFVASLAAHRTGHVDGGRGCPFCLDAATSYLFSSRLVACATPELHHRGDHWCRPLHEQSAQEATSCAA